MLLPARTEPMSQFHHVASGIEHRWGQRAAMDLPVLLIAAAGSRWTVRMRELSISGALVATSTLLPELSRVDLNIIVRGTLYRRRQWIHAYVARCTPTGMALCWMDLAPASIVELVATALAAADRQGGCPHLQPHDPG